MFKWLKNIVNTLTGNAGASEIARQQKIIADQQLAADQAQATLAANSARDLSNENITDVAAGGTAAESGAIDTLRRKRQTGGGLASTVGLTV